MILNILELPKLFISNSLLVLKFSYSPRVAFLSENFLVVEDNSSAAFHL